MQTSNSIVPEPRRLHWSIKNLQNKGKKLPKNTHSPRPRRKKRQFHHFRNYHRNIPSNPGLGPRVIDSGALSGISAKVCPKPPPDQKLLRPAETWPKSKVKSHRWLKTLSLFLAEQLARVIVGLRFKGRKVPSEGRDRCVLVHPPITCHPLRPVGNN